MRPLVVLTWACAVGCAAPDAGTRPSNEATAHDHRVLHVPGAKATVVLFPCFSCDAADTEAESAIPEACAEGGIDVVLMNTNLKIWLENDELAALSDTLSAILERNELNDANVFLGGFSSGGNVATLLAKHAQSTGSSFTVSGLFVVDSPLDLEHLYANCANDKDHPNHLTAEEARVVTSLLEGRFGRPGCVRGEYDEFSPVSHQNASIEPLSDIAVRLYCEPDTAWWRTERGQRYDELNAFRLKLLHEQFLQIGHERAELIETTGRGVQHGNRHPHAWSIVDADDLVKWVLKNAE